MALEKDNANAFTLNTVMKISASRFRHVCDLTDVQMTCLDVIGVSPTEIFRSKGWTLAEIKQAVRKRQKYMASWRSKQEALQKPEGEKPLSGTMVWYATQRGIAFTTENSSVELYSKVAECMKHGHKCPRMWQVRIGIYIACRCVNSQCALNIL